MCVLLTSKWAWVEKINLNKGQYAAFYAIQLSLLSFVSGLVKLNYSGPWSVKDVWESGGWEPRPDQLSWQKYELAAAISSTIKEHVSTRTGDKQPV